jgi:hypothetical protein
MVEIAEFTKGRTDKHLESSRKKKIGVRIPFIQQPLRFPKETVPFSQVGHEYD